MSRSHAFTREIMYVQRCFACDREINEIEIPEAEVDNQYHLGHQGLPCCMLSSSVTFQRNSTGPGTRQGVRAGFNGDSNINVLNALGTVNVILGFGECEPWFLWFLGKYIDIVQDPTVYIYFDIRYFWPSSKNDESPFLNPQSQKCHVRDKRSFLFLEKCSFFCPMCDR